MFAQAASEGAVTVGGQGGAGNFFQGLFGGESAIRASAVQGLLRDATLFDIYRPQPTKEGAAPNAGGLAAGEKSMAVRLGFYSDTATLTDEQVDPAVQAIVAHLASLFGARLRG